MRSDFARYEHDLSKDSALTERIFGDAEHFPVAPPKRERLVIRTDGASIDLAVCRALALAVAGAAVLIELTETKRAVPEHD